MFEKVNFTFAVGPQDDQQKQPLSEQVTNVCRSEKVFFFWTSVLVLTDAACPPVPQLCQKYQAENWAKRSII